MARLVIRGAWRVLFVWLALASPALAQDFRGSIVGTVTDTHRRRAAGRDGHGHQHRDDRVADARDRCQGRAIRRCISIPGKYAVTAQLSGFKKIVRPSTDVRIGDALRIDIVLEAGGVNETVQVVAESPLLNTSSGVSGTTIDTKQIAELPLGDGTAYMLTRLAPGIVDSSDLHFARPMDNGNLAGIVANGVLGGNEFTIDGAPNMSNARGVGFSPPSDAIAQFKVQTNAFDAQTGHTAGAVVNLALKSGTNSLARARRATSTATTTARRRRCSASGRTCRSRRASTTGSRRRAAVRS